MAHIIPVFQNYEDDEWFFWPSFEDTSGKPKGPFKSYADASDAYYKYIDRENKIRCDHEDFPVD